MFVSLSGVHATIAGVALGLAMAQQPALRTRHALEPWVNVIVLPLFAFSAALVAIPAVSMGELSPAFWGVLVALPVGKIVGISLFGWVSLRIGTQGRRAAAALRGSLAAGALGGIGFTVSLLLSELAFTSQPEIRDQAILGVLAGSVISLIAAGILVSLAGGAPSPAGGGGGGAMTGGTVDPLREAAETMHAVRDRCVWTQQIDHRALVPYLIEESAELIDAVEEGSRAELREELGDLLWQVLFHAEIASRDADEPFDIDDVARGLTEKMVRRHPHVFGDAVANTPEEVLVLWNAAKAAEKHERRSVLDGVSERMPSLALAQKLLGKGAQVGVGAAAGSGAGVRGRARRRAARPGRAPPATTGGMPSARSASGCACSRATSAPPSGRTERPGRIARWHPSIRRAACATSSPPRRPAASACSPSSASATARTASTRSRRPSWRSTRACTPASAATTRSSPTTCSSAASTRMRSAARPTILRR